MLQVRSAEEAHTVGIFCRNKGCSKVTRYHNAECMWFRNWGSLNEAGRAKGYSMAMLKTTLTLCGWHQFAPSSFWIEFAAHAVAHERTCCCSSLPQFCEVPGSACVCCHMYWMLLVTHQEKWTKLCLWDCMGKTQTMIFGSLWAENLLFEHN